MSKEGGVGGKDEVDLTETSGSENGEPKANREARGDDSLDSSSSSSGSDSSSSSSGSSGSGAESRAKKEAKAARFRVEARSIQVHVDYLTLAFEGTWTSEDFVALKMVLIRQVARNIVKDHEIYASSLRDVCLDVDTFRECLQETDETSPGNVSMFVKKLSEYQRRQELHVEADGGGGASYAGHLSLASASTPMSTPLSVSSFSAYAPRTGLAGSSTTTGSNYSESPKGGRKKAKVVREDGVPWTRLFWTDMVGP